MTTAHVSVALLSGPPPTEDELLDGLAWVLQRHPMLAACVRGKSKHYLPDAQEYPLHSDYIGRAFYYNDDLFKPDADDDLKRFEPSPLTAAQLARRALSVVALKEEEDEGIEEGLEKAWRGGFSEAMDGLTIDEDGGLAGCQVGPPRAALAGQASSCCGHA